jgi:hypothetical protein
VSYVGERSPPIRHPANAGPAADPATPHAAAAHRACPEAVGCRSPKPFAGPTCGRRPMPPSRRHERPEAARGWDRKRAPHRPDCVKLRISEREFPQGRRPLGPDPRSAPVPRHRSDSLASRTRSALRRPKATVYGVPSRGRTSHRASPRRGSEVLGPGLRRPESRKSARGAGPALVPCGRAPGGRSTRLGSRVRRGPVALESSVPHRGRGQGICCALLGCSRPGGWRSTCGSTDPGWRDHREPSRRRDGRLPTGRPQLA